MKISAGHVTLPKVGETANGDRPVFRLGEGEALAAVIDGLGHGPEAQEVALRAVRHLDSIAPGTPLLDIMQQLHDQLAGSRGAAATVCVFRDGAIEACAVGNVELRSPDVRLPLVFSAGVLGVRVARYHICRAPITTSRARIVLFSDGISSRTPLEDYRRFSAAAACDAIVQKHRRKEDDATVLVMDVESIDG